MRVHAVARALAEQDVPTHLDYTPELDVLIVQKKLTEERLAIAQRAKADGCLLVYDIDDLGEALWYWTTPSLLEQILHNADLVITATEEQREQLRVLHNTEPIAVVPCPIDYLPTAPGPAQVRAGGTLRVLWFGSHSNLGLLEPYLEPLMALRDVQPVIVTNAACLSALSARHPSIECVAWSLDSFVTVLRGTDLTTLMHDGSAADRSKGNNKMVTSIAWGVPAVVSRTPDYERTAIELGVEGAVFDGPEDFASAIERLRQPRARSAYLRRAQPRVWRRYAGPAVARQLLRALDAAHRARGGAQNRRLPQDL